MVVVADSMVVVADSMAVEAGLADEALRAVAITAEATPAAVVTSAAALSPIAARMEIAATAEATQTAGTQTAGTRGAVTMGIAAMPAAVTMAATDTTAVAAITAAAAGAMDGTGEETGMMDGTAAAGDGESGSIPATMALTRIAIRTCTRMLVRRMYMADTDGAPVGTRPCGQSRGPAIRAGVSGQYRMPNESATNSLLACDRRWLYRMSVTSLNPLSPRA